MGRLLERSTVDPLGTPSSLPSIDGAAILSCDTLSQKNLHDLTMRMVQDAAASVVESPAEPALRRLSQMCEVATGNLLDYFTEAALTALSSCCLQVCSGSVSSHTDIEIMLAQNILAHLTVAFQALPTPSQTSVDIPPRARLPDMCQKRASRLFTDANAATTLKLTVLRLSLFCSQDHGFPSSRTLEIVKLARKIIAPVAVPVCQTWAQANSKLINKLLSRLHCQSLDIGARLEVRSLEQLPFAPAR